MDENTRHLAPCTPHNAIKCLARHAHLLRGLGVIQILNIRKPQSLQFVSRQFGLLKVAQRDAGRLEVGRGRPVGNVTRTERTWHDGKGKLVRDE